jgi:hypothetical protein
MDGEACGARDELAAYEQLGDGSVMMRSEGDGWRANMGAWLASQRMTEGTTASFGQCNGCTANELLVEAATVVTVCSRR